MRNSSLWSEFVTNADFINVDETEAIQELVSQTSELKAIFNHFKELYVSALNDQYKGRSYLGQGLSKNYIDNMRWVGGL